MMAKRPGQTCDDPDRPSGGPSTHPGGAPPAGGAPDAVVSNLAVSHGGHPILGDRTDAFARYHEVMAEPILAELANRPLAVLRHPEGIAAEGVFQRHTSDGWPADLRSFIGPDGDRALYLTDAAGLAAAVQIGVIEFHVQGVHRDRPDRPDRLVFDLDPDRALSFHDLATGAGDLRDLLAEMGMPTLPMVTGGKSIHVIAHLTRRSPTDDVTAFARRVAVRMAEHYPDRFVATPSRERRQGRIFIDWQRNLRGATAVAPWTVRARPGAPVAVPLDWTDLPRLRSAAEFGMAAAVEHAMTPPLAPKAVTLSLVAAALERSLAR